MILDILLLMTLLAAAVAGFRKGLINKLSRLVLFVLDGAFGRPATGRAVWVDRVA